MLLAWAAGFFDGEGNVLFIPEDGNRRRARVRIQIGQSGAPDLLERFQAAVGCGHVMGPYFKEKPSGGLALPMYRFNTSRCESVQHVMCSLWPWLGEVKRAQFRYALLSARAQNASYVPLRGVA